MPVELNIVESVTELDTTVVTVILESASEPGPAGPGVATGGTVGQVLTKDSSTDYDTSWQDATGGGGGGVTDADYLVGTAHAGLSAEIVVGTSPQGELGGTWASPTVDTTHSGSSHASVQAAAEATAAGALSTHSADTTAVHGITDTSALALSANVQPLDSDLTAIAALTTTAFGRGLLELANQAALLSAAGAAAASHAHAGEDITSGTVADARIASTIARDSEVTSAISALSSVYQPLDSDLTAIAALTTTSFGRGLLDDADAAAGRATLVAAPAAAKYIVQTADSELSAEQALGALATGIVKNTTTTGVLSIATANTDYAAAAHASRHEDAGADEISIQGLSGTPAELTNHLNDTSAAHAASAISFSATGTIAATDVQAAIAEVASEAASVMVLIQEITVASGGAASIDFTSIPGTYRHLELWCRVRSENAEGDMLLRFNNDSGANYALGLIRSIASSANAATLGGQTAANILPLPATGAVMSGYGKIIVPYYATGTEARMAMGNGGGAFAGGYHSAQYMITWTGTGAITRITLFNSNGGTDIKEGSIVSLYGIT